MKIESIKFTQGKVGDGDEGALPHEITVTMSLAEAVFIAKVAGTMSDVVAEDRGLPLAFHGVYSALCGDVFNRYWDNGVDEVEL